MSVVVKGMKMPKNCFYCAMSSFGVCNIAVRIWDISTRPDWCPLVELPENHGPLIDRNELEKAVLKWLPPDPCGREEKEYPFETDICVSMMMEIEEQETIVEAEG